LPVPRVASEASSVQSHQLHPNPRRAAGPDAASNGTPSPFAALLDDATAAADDRADRPQAPAASPSSSQADNRARRGNDDDRPTTADDAQQPNASADTKSDDTTDAKINATTDTKVEAAKTTDGTTGDGVSVQADTTATTIVDDASSDGAATQSPTPDPQAIVPAVTVPAVAVPTTTTIDVTAQAGATDNADGAKPASQAAAVLGTLAQDTGVVEAAADGKGKPGPRAADAINAAGANKTVNVKPNAETDATPTTNDAAPTDGDTSSGSQATAHAEPGADPSTAAKSAHAPAPAGRSGSSDAASKSDDADTPVATKTQAPTDKLQVTTLPNQPSDRAAAPAAAATAAPTTNVTATTVPVAGLAVAIASQAQAGHTRFEIRLDPPELGRIDVRLDVHKDGQVTSRLVVEKAETLDLLRRDAPQLERALQDAGLKTSDNGLQFTLRDQGSSGQNQAWSDGNRGNAARLVVPDSDMPPVEIAQSGYGSSLRAGGGIDIRV
jgi:chemotaxis protein MotD